MSTSPFVRAALDRIAELRAEHRANMETEYALAEAVTNGAMLNERGRAKGIDPWSFFRSNWTYVKAYASPELIEWLELNPRQTFAQFERQMFEPGPELDLLP